MLSPQAGRNCVNTENTIPYWSTCPWEHAPVTWGDLVMQDKQIFVQTNPSQVVGYVERVEF